MERDQQPRPDESPEKHHESGDTQVLFDRQAGNHGRLVIRDVTAGIEAEKQDDANESDAATQSKSKPGPGPVLDPVMDGAGVHVSQHLGIEADIAGGRPVDGTDLHMIVTGAAHHIVRAGVRLAGQKTSRHTLAARLEEAIRRRPD